MRPTPRAPGRRSAAALLPVLALLVLAAGCGSASAPSPPTGVDGLEIPTPTLTPSDFVEGVDNPWLPLEPGNEWVYTATSSAGAATVTVTVLDETREIGGVRATVVHDVMTDAKGVVREDTFDWYAQDTAGNVWHLGESTTAYDDGKPSTEGSWEAGVDGAQAGLAMLAEPRVGDGYRTGLLRGEAEDRARVLALDASSTVPFGSFRDLLWTEVTSPLVPGVVEHRFHAEGVGLVREETVEGGDRVVVLDSFTGK